MSSRRARLTGLDGLREIVAALDGYELAARRVGARGAAGAPRSLRAVDARHDLPRRRGRMGRLSPRPSSAAPAPAWCRRRRSRSSCASTPRRGGAAAQPRTSRRSRETPARVLSVLAARGASFFRDLASACGLDADQLRQAIGALVAGGLVASDGFSGLRALVWAARGRPAQHDRRSNFAGRWTRHRAEWRGASRATRPSSSRRGRCCAATASCSAGCSRARPTPRPGASSRASTGGSRRAAKSAAAGSSPACRASSSRCPTRSSGCARSGASRPTAAWSPISAADPLNLDRHRHRGRTHPDRRPQRHRLSRRRAARGARRRTSCASCGRSTGHRRRRVASTEDPPRARARGAVMTASRETRAAFREPAQPRGVDRLHPWV